MTTVGLSWNKTTDAYVRNPTITVLDALDLLGRRWEMGGALIVGNGGTLSSSIVGASIITNGITVEAGGSLDRTNISVIRSCGPVDTSAGTSVMGTDKLIMCGQGSRALKTAAGQTFYDLIVASEATTLLGSNIAIANERVQCADNIVYGAYAITMTDPEKTYDRARIHPLIDPVGILDTLGPGDGILSYLAMPQAILDEVSL